MNIVDKIRQIRIQKGLSQEYLASQLNIHQSTYNSIENGNSELKITTLEKIAEILEVDVRNFFGGTETIFYINNNTHTDSQVGYVNYNSFDEERKTLYEKQIQKLEEEIAFLREMLKDKLK
jgi:transcriptional regulator with XRE-family HTH domain